MGSVRKNTEYIIDKPCKIENNIQVLKKKNRLIVPITMDSSARKADENN